MSDQKAGRVKNLTEPTSPNPLPSSINGDSTEENQPNAPTEEIACIISLPSVLINFSGS